MDKMTYTLVSIKMHETNDDAELPQLMPLLRQIKP